MISKVFFCADQTATVKLSAQIASLAFPGLTVCLSGQLGAGKTNWVQGFCKQLNVDPLLVNSPTFVIIQEYPAQLTQQDGTHQSITVYHFDAYRIKDDDEFCELGAEEILASQNICLLEWGEKVSEFLPEDRLHIVITATGETSRRFELTALGTKTAELLNQLPLAS